MPLLHRLGPLLMTAAASAAIALVPPPAHAQIRIIGSLGNFDVYNHTEHECNEFEIELDGPHPEDVFHTYHNPNYGPPTITSLPGNTGIRVVYTTPGHATQPNAIEHFGVSLRPGHPVTAQRFTWVIGGVNPPYPPPPPPPPPPPLAIPLVTSQVIYLPTGAIVRQTVTNVDPLNRVVWVQRRVVSVPREVALEELMPNDPLIKGAGVVDELPERLFVGQPLVIEEDAPPAGELHSEVVVYDIFTDLGGRVGPRFTCLLTAELAAGDNCPAPYLPTFTLQPQSVTTVLDAAVLLIADATGPESYGNLDFQWRHEGVDIPGAHDSFLEIDPVRPQDAGAYTLVASNDCGFVHSQTAHIVIEYPPPCRADFDQDGAVNSQDFFDFLDSFFQSRAFADMNNDLRINSQDFFDFITAFFNGC